MACRRMTKDSGQPFQCAGWYLNATTARTGLERSACPIIRAVLVRATGLQHACMEGQEKGR